MSELSRGLNPEKGYTVSANGKYTSDHHKNDYGAWGAGTAREIRITELIQAKIDAGEKMNAAYMKVIQQDSIDTYARHEVPLMIKALEIVKEDYS